jgi:hypothetical protein
MSNHDLTNDEIKNSQENIEPFMYEKKQKTEHLIMIKANNDTDQIINENDENKKLEIDKLKKKKKSLEKNIYELYNIIKNKKNEINNIENRLLHICNHEWIYENVSGLYIKPDKICIKCDSRIYRF